MSNRDSYYRGDKKCNFTGWDDSCGDINNSAKFPNKKSAGSNYVNSLCYCKDLNPVLGYKSGYSNDLISHRFSRLILFGPTSMYS